jgi:CheY-like chemotaxis protein
MMGATDPVRVLVIDDNRDAAGSLAMVLRLWGFDARTAFNGPEGLEVARAYRPHCVLSDIGLPGLDGYHLAERFRQDESLREIPLIAVTAYAEPERAKAAGFDAHLVKPADLPTLQSLLRKFANMDKRLDRAEELVEKQGEVISKAIDVMNEVKDDVKEIKEGLQEVKDDVKEIKEELKGKD